MTGRSARSARAASAAGWPHGLEHLMGKSGAAKTAGPPSAAVHQSHQAERELATRERASRRQMRADAFRERLDLASKDVAVLWRRCRNLTDHGRQWAALRLKVAVRRR